MEEVRQRLGPIGVLINNAANDHRQNADEVSEEDWDRAMAVNLKHQFFAAQIARRSMRELGGGAIVNFSSTAFMLGIHQSVCLFRRQGRRRRPDHEPRARVRTRQHPRQRHRAGPRRHRAAATSVDERGRSSPISATRQCLIHRNIVPEDIARAALFLSADDSAMITKQCFLVDAGLR